MTSKTRNGIARRKNLQRAACEALEGRLFLAAQISATTSAHLPDVVAFNAVTSGYTGAGPSRTETVTITDTGSSPLTFGSGAFSIVNDPTTGANAGNFTITNAGSLPGSLAAGASATINLQYSSTALFLQSALLKISSNDPVTPFLTINLHGIGTPGQFGVDEPSLVQVLRAHNIPTIIGAGPNDVNINVQKYPINPDPSSQEVAMQRMVAADSALPVTITPIASFSASTQPVTRVGYYVPGDPNTTTELFYIAKADAQVVDPTAVGATSFNPGTSPFALYGTFPGTSTPNGSLDTHYSEDALNVLDPTHERKIRFFPLKNANGSVVPNSFVFAMEDYNDPTAFNSFINFVGIISNVQAAPNAALGSTPAKPAGTNPPVMDVQENQDSPGSTTLVFNTIKVPDLIAPDVVHNTNTITIYNTGDQPLTINSLTLSDTRNWALVSPPTPGTQIAGNSSLAVTIKFIATTNPPHTNDQTNDVVTTNDISSVAAGGVWNGTLTINSSDSVNPTRTINLAGYWQSQSEHENEPNVATMTNLMFGYTTQDTGAAAKQGTEYPNNGNTPVLYGSEVDPSTNQGLLVSADGGSVSLIEVGAWHQQFITFEATDGTNTQGAESATESGTTVTITTQEAHKFKAGDQVTIAFGNGGSGAAGYTGTFTITSVPTPTTFTYTLAASGLAPYITPATQAQAGYFPAGGSAKFLYKDAPANSQSMFPLLDPDSFSTVQTSFTPTGAFGISLDGENSVDSKNPVDLTFNNSSHAIRFWPLIDANGNTVPNTWLVGLDYRNYENPNGDYQDLFMILTNATFESIPATPIDLQATQGSSGVNLQWAAMTTATAGYNVYQSVNGSAFTKLTSSPVKTTSYVDNTAPAGSTVKYEVTSVNSTGTESQPEDASIKPATSSGPTTPAIQQADGSSGTQVVLTWTASAGAVSYNVQREDPGQSTFHSVAGGSGSTSFTDMNVTAGSTYLYEVQAVGSSGSSAFSSPATAMVTVPQSAPSAPVIQSADGSSPSQVVVTWTAVSGATSYTVEREDPGQSTFQTVSPMGGVTTTTFTDTSVTSGATYSYEVVAVNAVGPSPASAPFMVTVATAATAPATPTMVQTTTSATSVAITWTASAGATSYDVQREGPGESTFSDAMTGLTAPAFTDTSVLAGQTYQYQVVAVNATGNSAPSSPPVSATIPGGATLDIMIGTGAGAFVRYVTAAGTTVMVRLAGAGTATVHFTADSISQSPSGRGVQVIGQNVSIGSITTTGTTGGSSLSITTKGGTKAVSIGGISAGGSLNSITASTASLIGGLSVTGAVKRITLAAATAATITIGSTLGVFQVGAATGLTLTAGGAIRSIVAGSWSSNHSITAPSIGSITIRGDAEFGISSGVLRTLHVGGTLHDSTLALTAGGALDLTSLSAGVITNTAIGSAGNLGSISATILDNAQIFAGDGGQLLGTFPLAGAFPASAFISSITLRKAPGVVNDVNSSIVASTLKRVVLGNVKLNNGGTAFGLEANVVNSLSFADSTVGKTKAFTKLTSAAIVTADLASKGLNTQDFKIDVV